MKKAPPLFRDRPTGAQIVLACVLPILFGGVCGYLLGVNGSAYEVLTLVGVLGGLGAGYEHPTPREGLLRGVLGGALFALSIVVVHELTGEPADTDLPAPLGVMALIYTAAGTGLGALGGKLRARREGRGAS